MREKAARQVVIRLAMPPQDRSTVEAMLDVMARHKGDRKVVLELELRGGAQPLRVKAEVLGQNAGEAVVAIGGRPGTDVRRGSRDAAVARHGSAMQARAP